MKILFYSAKSVYTGSIYGGAERSMTVMAEAFAQQSADVHFLTEPGGKRLLSSKRFTSNRVQVSVLPVLRFPGGSFSIVKKLNLWIRNRLLVNYLNKYFLDADIVYTYNEYPGLYQLVKWKQSKSVSAQIVYRAAGMYWYEDILKRYPNLQTRIEYTFSHVDSANFISTGIRDMFFKAQKKGQYDFKFRREFILDIGVETTTSDHKWSYSSEGIFTVVMVARFVGVPKRHDLLIEAFKQWKPTNARIVFLGDGPEMQKWVDFCEGDEYLRDKVIFEGFVSHDKISGFLAAASLFCLATDHEALSKAVVEAMGIGVPLLVSDVPALNTYIIDMKNGMLVQNSVKAWSDALQRVYKMSQSGLSQLSARETSFAMDHFSIDTNLNEYKDYFYSLTKS